MVVYSFVSEGSKVEGKKYGGDVLAVSEFLQIDLLFSPRDSVALCEVR
jgi:hypothetical protein